MKTKNPIRKLISIVLIFAMVLTLLPAVPLMKQTAKAAPGTPPVRTDVLKVVEEDGLPAIYVDQTFSLGYYGLSASEDYDCTYELILEEASDTVISVDYRIMPCSMPIEAITADNLYGTIVFEPGQTLKTLTFSINDISSNAGITDKAAKRWSGARHIMVQFTNPVGASLHQSETPSVMYYDLYESPGRSLNYTLPINGTAEYPNNGTNARYNEFSTGGNILSYQTAVVPNTYPPNDEYASIIYTLETGPSDYGWLVRALEDSDAAWVILGITQYATDVAGAPVGSSDLYSLFGYASPVDAYNNILYDENDYIGWIMNWTVGYWNDFELSIPGLQDGFPLYVFPRQKFFDFANMDTQRISLYRMCIRDDQGPLTVDFYMVQGHVFTLFDQSPPRIVGITTPQYSGVSYRPGDIIPITVEFSEAVSNEWLMSLGDPSLLPTPYILVNGQAAPCTLSPDRSISKYMTFFYTVQDVDNADTLEISIAPEMLANPFLRDLSGNTLSPLYNDPQAGEINLSDTADPNYSPAYITAQMITPLESMAITDLTTDKTATDYEFSENIKVTLTDHGNAAVSAWLRSSIDSNDFTVGGAYLAVMNPVSGVPDTYAFTAQEPPNLDGSFNYIAEIPAELYATYAESMQIALYYGSGVTRDGDSFSGGDVAFDKLLYVTFPSLVLVTGITLDYPANPEDRLIYIAEYDTPIQLTAEIAPTNASFTEVVWTSSDPEVADIDKDGIIFPIKAGTVYFTATATNGGFGAISEDTEEFTISAGGPPVIKIPEGTHFSTRRGDALTVKWVTNLPFEDTVFTIKLWPDDNPLNVTELHSDTLSGPSFEIAGNKLTELSQPDVALSLQPAYHFSISAPYPGNPGDPGAALKAEGDIFVYPQPALIKFAGSGSPSFTDETGQITIKWRAENLAQGDSFILTVYRNDEDVEYEIIRDFVSGDNIYNLTIPQVSGLKDTYSVQALGINASGASVDSITLNVYNHEALQIMVSDALGNSSALRNGDMLELSNRNKIAELYNGGGQAGSEAILDLKRDISLQNYISINYGDYAWSLISDQIEWLSDNTAVATINYRQGTSYEPLSVFTYTKYSPTTTFSLAGAGDGEAVISATHAATGQTVSVDVSVETLKDRLYIFQFYPAQATTVSYINGEGQPARLTSGTDGALAVYEPSGITGDISLQSGSGDMIYLGTIYNDKLKSGEQNSANRGLYPVNIFQLRNTKLDVFLKQPNGETPWTGSVRYSGAVYKNGKLCEESIIRGGTMTVSGAGRFLLNLDATNFWVEDRNEDLGLGDKLEFEFVLECGSGNAYYPVYLRVDGNLNTVDVVNVGVNIVPLRANSSGSPNAFLAAQNAVSPNLPGSPDVRTYDGNVGPGNRIPELTLRSTVLWWGENPDQLYSADIMSEKGAELQVQIISTRKLPFIDMAITVNEALLSDGSIGPGTTLNLKAGQGVPVKLNALAGGYLKFSVPMAFWIFNGVGIEDPDKNERMQLQLNQLTDQLNTQLFDKQQLADIAGSKLLELTGCLDLLQKYSSFAALGQVNVTYEPTSDPLLYYVFLDIFSGDKGNMSVGTSFGIDPFDLEINVYIKGEARVERETGNWSLQIVEGGASIGLSLTQPVGTIMLPLFTIAINLRADVKMAMQFNRNETVKNKTDNLLSLMISAGISGQTGIGFSGDVLGFFVGVYGELLFNVYLGMLNVYEHEGYFAGFIPQDYFTRSGGTRLSLSGEIGAKAEITLIFFTISVSYKIYEFDVPLGTFGSYNEIKAYVDKYGIKDLFGQFSSRGIASAAFNLYAAGRVDEAVALVKSVTNAYYIEQDNGDWSLESRDYLSALPRNWYSGGGLSRSSVGVRTDQTNAYPYSNPLVSDDGVLLVLRSDGDSEDINDTNISWSTGSSSGYAVPDRIASSTPTSLYAASRFDLAGKSSFAAVAWEAQREEISQTSAPLTAAEMDAVMNNTEIVAAIYQGGSWSAKRLTDNYQPDLSPVVAAGGSRAFAAWRNTAGSGIVKLDEGESEEGSLGLELNYDDISSRICYSIYSGGSWSEAEVLLGNASNISSMAAAMLPDDTIALVYLLDGDAYCMIMESNGSISRSVRLSSGGTSINPQIQAVTIGGDQQFVIAWYQENSEGYSGIVFAALSGDGAVNETIGRLTAEALAAQNIGIGGDFRFAPNSLGTLDGLSLLWSGLVPPVDPAAAASAILYGSALRLDSDGSIFFTAPMTVTETGEEEQFTVFDGWYDSGGLHAVMLIRDWAEYYNRGSTIASVTKGFDNDIEVSASVNQEEIVHGFTTVFPFYVTNLGSEIIRTVEITLADGTSKLFTGLRILPTQTMQLNLEYKVPEGKNQIVDLGYTAAVTASSAGGTWQNATGKLDIAIPNIGITSIDLINAGGGLRTFRVSLQNLSDVEFDGNTAYSAHLGIYADPEYRYPVYDADGKPMICEFSGSELEMLDESALTKLLTYAIPGSGFADGDIRLYARAWAEENGAEIEQYYKNSTGSILFTDPVEANDGNPIRLEVSQSNASGVSVATVTVTNLAMVPAPNGNVVATLLGQNGEVLETLIYATSASGLINLYEEGEAEITFTFSQAGYSVQVGYYTADPTAMNADLASLQLSAVAIAFDKDTTSYSLSATNVGSTTLTAAAVNPAATVSVLDSSGRTLASGTGAVSYALPLQTGGTANVQVLVKPAVSGAATKSYSLRISNTISNAGGIVISASGGSVTITDNSSQGFVPVAWKYCLDGEWSSEQPWGSTNSFEPGNTEYLSLYVRVFDADGRYMDSNTLSYVSTSGSGTGTGGGGGGGAPPPETDKKDETTSAPVANPFTDLKESDWFYEAAMYVYAHGLMNGTSPTLFSPNSKLTRGMLVTVLHRLAMQNGIENGEWKMENKDGGTNNSQFADVLEGMYYYDAVAWAAENGIVSGYGNGKFGPNDNITREQLATILYRYCLLKGIDVSVGEDTNILSYEDAFDISEYAIPAFQWACGAGIINGKPGGYLDPKGTATRAEVATVLQRFLEMLG